MRRHRCLPLVYGLFLFLSTTVFAEDRLGKLELDEIILRPELRFIEPFEGEFALEYATVGVLWTLDGNFSARLRWGPLAQVNTPVIYSPDASPESWGVYEAFGQFQGTYGRLRAGLIPLDFGLEGKLQENRLDFPRAMPFRLGIVGLRDLGLSYYVGHNGYYTQMTVHNGEGGANKDGRMWYGANWGWENSRNIHVGLSGQTGSTEKESTQTSTAELAGFDPQREAHWRQGMFFVHWYPRRWDFRLGVFAGEREQDEKVERYQGAHSDLIYAMSPQWKLMTRYDYFDPDTREKNDRSQEISLGIGIDMGSGTSTLHIIGTKVLEEDKEVANDRLLLSWLIVPKF